MSPAETALQPYRELLAAPFDQVAADLDAFAKLLIKWNAVQNLVSRETLGELWTRHIGDSLQLLPLLRATDTSVLDIGSGGGFPAIPLAIASRGVERRFTLLEPVGKKAAFLKTAARGLALPVTVHAVRAEQFDSRETFPVMTSRALAKTATLMAYLERYMRPGNRLVLPKGREYREEVSEAAQLYDFDVLEHRSVTDAEGVVLEVSNLRAKSAR